jgi:hypothetical protein
MGNFFRKGNSEMKTRLMVLAAAGLIGFAASADVLYWQVNNTDIEYDNAVLMAIDTSDNNKLYYVSENLDSSGNDLGGGGFVGKEALTGGNHANGVMDLASILAWDDDTTNPSSLSTLSFYVELYNGGTYAGRTSTPQSYQSLVDSGVISNGLNPNFNGVNSALGSGTGGGFTDAVPEPTSGLLMLIGLGALALRRRKV